MHPPSRCAGNLLLAAVGLSVGVRTFGQPIIRETPTTLVLPIPGAGGGPDTGGGSGAAGSVLPPAAAR